MAYLWAGFGGGSSYLGSAVGDPWVQPPSEEGAQRDLAGMTGVSLWGAACTVPAASGRSERSSLDNGDRA
ncbi:MAG: hypothetical protein ACP5O0_03835 [Acidimicrobiales bacterium]